MLSAAPLAAQALLFEHAAVIDATGAPPRADVSVLVRDGLIARIGPGVEAPAGATVVDASGKFLIPGLWDMHVHLSGGFEPSFRALLRSGITGIRDMYSGMAPGDYQRWRNTPVSVRMVVAGLIGGPSLKPAPGAIPAANEDDARTAFRLLAASGAEFIVVGKDLSREAYLAVAAEARRIGAAFAGEVPSSIRPEEAAAEGQLSLEGLPPAGTSLDAIAEHGTWITPLLGKASSEEREIAAEIRRAGIGILAGTDSAALGTSLHEELALLVEAAGLTPMEALQTATRNPAFYFGTLPLMGTLEVGKVADIVVLDANPLEDIRNTRKIDSVVMRGRYFSRAALDALAQGSAYPSSAAILSASFGTTTGWLPNVLRIFTPPGASNCPVWYL